MSRYSSPQGLWYRFGSCRICRGSVHRACGPRHTHGDWYPTRWSAPATTTEVENYPGFPDGSWGRNGGSLREASRPVRTRSSVQNGRQSRFVSAPFPIVGGRRNGAHGRCGHHRDGRLRQISRRTRRAGVSRSRCERLCATCDGFFFRDQEIVVVGGGDTAMEEAHFLTRFASKVWMVSEAS